LLLHNVSQSYGKRPSEIIGIVNELIAYDFDASVLFRASSISKGEITDKKVIKQRQSAGFAAVKMLQSRAQPSYDRGKK